MKVEKPLNLSKEEAEIIRKALHLEEISICEVYNDDISKYQRQLRTIKKLYNKLNTITQKESKH